MLIDWITAYLPFTHMSHEHVSLLRSFSERVLRFKPENDPDFFRSLVDSATGQTVSTDTVFFLNRDSVVFESACWESVRSDSHQIAFRVGSDSLWIQGSPARVCGSGDAIFGEGPSAALDLVGCLKRMAAFVSQRINIPLIQPFDAWHVSRIDVTGNLLLDDLASVRVALRSLRDCEGGRYRVSQQAGDTVYWSHKSRLRAGKAYAKGPHIEYQTKKADYTGREYTEQEKAIANRLLRLELRLGAQWLRERCGKPWHQLTPNDLQHEWTTYFNRMIGDSEMTSDDNIQQRIEAVSETPGKAKAAYSFFLLIQSIGWQKAKEVTAKPTFYRHLKLLRDAGLGDADISAGKIVPLRRKVLECQEVSSWAEVYKIAA